MNKKFELLREAVGCYKANHVSGDKNEKELLSFINELEAITVTRCCTQLKVKEKPTFEEWIEKCGMQKVGNRIILKNNNQVSLGFMLEIYSGQINSGLL